MALLVRWWVKEPERWTHAHEQETSPLSAIFEGNLRRGTLVGSALAFVAVFGLWGSTNWTPTLIRELPDLKGQDPATLTKYVSYAIMALNAGRSSAIWALVHWRIGSGAGLSSRSCVWAVSVMLPITFLAPTSYSGVLMLLPILGFFNNGIFSGFPIYLPELYPTRLRATGAGFCFNAGRVLASASPFLTGWLVTTLGSFGRAASTVALIYLWLDWRSYSLRRRPGQTATGMKLSTAALRRSSHFGSKAGHYRVFGEENNRCRLSVIYIQALTSHQRAYFHRYDYYTTQSPDPRREESRRCGLRRPPIQRSMVCFSPRSL